VAGTYHVAAAGHTSWHGYAQLVIEWARSHGVPVKVGASAIVAIPTSAYAAPACRPLNSRLDTRRLQQTFGLTMPPWQTGVLRMLAETHSA
jgi:dTDP-4-dehydrorhamnose reductase